MIPGWKPAAGMHLFYLDGAGVLFAEATQELHLLNITATAIWSLLEEGHDGGSASAALRDMYGLDEVSSSQFVAAALAEWREKGFLQGTSTDPPRRGPIIPAATTRTGLAEWRPQEPVEVRYYRILGSRFRVSYSSIAQARMVHPVLEHLEVPESSDEATAVDIVESADRSTVYRDRVAFDECAGIAALAPIVKSLVWTTTVAGHAFFLDIHAGVIGDGSRCILLPAPAGSGKSTLTAALVHAGYRYFSDEVALLEEGSFRVFPLPLAIGIKTSGIDALAGRFPILRGLQIHERGDGKQVVYMPPPRDRLPPTDEPCPVAALVFPRYLPDAATSLANLAKCDALKRLMDECVVVPARLDFKKVEALVAWVARTPCLDLTYGSTESAISAIRPLFVDNVGEKRVMGAQESRPSHGPEGASDAGSA